LQGQEKDLQAETLKILQLNNCFSLPKKNGESPEDKPGLSPKIGSRIEIPV